MDYASAIECTGNRHYLEAANFLLKEHLRERIHALPQTKREQVTQTLARKLGANHRRLHHTWNGTKSPAEISEEAYAETMVFFKGKNQI
ncbi:MAG: hypothetical protein HYY01_13150 [Chloroflexi bacterium]|nr:hypothetical protein [Chloroflexota bacterium]